MKQWFINGSSMARQHRRLINDSPMIHHWPAISPLSLPYLAPRKLCGRLNLKINFLNFIKILFHLSTNCRTPFLKSYHWSLSSWKKRSLARNRLLASNCQQKCGQKYIQFGLPNCVLLRQPSNSVLTQPSKTLRRSNSCPNGIWQMPRRRSNWMRRLESNCFDCF